MLFRVVLSLESSRKREIDGKAKLADADASAERLPLKVGSTLHLPERAYLLIFS